MVIRSQGICHKGGLDQLVRIPFTNKFNQLSKLFWIKTYMCLKYILKSVCNRPANLHICLLGTEQLQFQQERFGMPEGFCQSMPGCRTALHILTSADYSILQDPLDLLLFHPASGYKLHILQRTLPPTIHHNYIHMYDILELQITSIINGSKSYKHKHI